jgi:hypothetical protein
MRLRNNKFGKLFGPSFSFAGYILLAVGIIAVSYSLTSLIFIIPGMFIAFTYSGTVIDIENKRVKPYTSLFGIVRTGNWINVSQFSRFSIEKKTRRYTSYSRTNLRLDTNMSVIQLLLINQNGTRKIVLNEYSKFEDAQKEMEELSEFLLSKEENIKI